MQLPEAGATHVTVEHSTQTDLGGPGHTRITIHRVGPGGGNPFHEYDTLVYLSTSVYY